MRVLLILHAAVTISHSWPMISRGSKSKLYAAALIGWRGGRLFSRKVSCCSLNATHTSITSLIRNGKSLHCSVLIACFFISPSGASRASRTVCPLLSVIFPFPQ
ncbi:unnamed protein product [Pleuronectes platessa]|uniref:Secreted protein n=1 Tax=Pleuronectes platessa TaxID=8262 RepID=A0A9N7VBE4_PLEPL|nr:unnamed protein product [Pleuronectes platessa]